jgi:hypothetical protein
MLALPKGLLASREINGLRQGWTWHRNSTQYFENRELTGKQRKNRR